jgi:ribosomal protein S18 acetylase RimI-like enzyme
MEIVNTSPEIIDYTPMHQQWFEKFNRDWIEKYFWMEPIDVQVLQNPDEHIIKKGGYILMAKVNGEIVGTVALKFVAEGVYEFTKMAVDEKYRGLKIGEALTNAAIGKARALKAKKIVLYSSTKLKPALSLYEKVGFQEIPVDGPYKRSDIKMELLLEEVTPSDIKIRMGTLEDAALLRNMGVQTFNETFAPHNTAENMKMYLEKNFTLEQVNNELSDPNSAFFIAQHLTTTIGYIKLRTGNEPQSLQNKAIEIERLYSIKPYIGKTVGKKLIETAFEVAMQKGFKTIWLGVWENNIKALAFYEKFGFKKFSSHIFMLGTDKQTDYLVKKEI